MIYYDHSWNNYQEMIYPKLAIKLELIKGQLDRRCRL